MSDLARLRTDLVLVEQTYRGELSYIVKDPATHKYFRFRPVEVAVMRAIQGATTAAEAAAALTEDGIRVTGAAVAKFADKLKSMGVNEALIITDSVDDNLYLSSRNLPTVLVVEPRHADPVSLLRFEKTILTKAAVAKMQEMLA